MKKYQKGIFRSPLTFNSHRKGIGFWLEEIGYRAYAKVAGEWQKAKCWLKKDGEWLLAKAHAKHNHQWS
jgi:hypothetical protein